MSVMQKVQDFAGSTTHAGRYLCTYILIGGMWFLVGMERTS